ncbi:MAG TPA: LamG-like jellyroll fold domain-containing protein, partial [Archangium sp.]|uniref:LamG-like jellyroll fold domain-containing protein n=1 Tax=Archangium sp. TaxID=1872627 RepID=UPI002ED9E5C0
ALAITFNQPVSVGTVSSGNSWCDSGGCALQGGSDFVDAAHPLGTWRLVSGVYVDTSKKITVYVDGVKDGEVTFTTAGSPQVNGATLQLGRRKSNNGAMAGRLDDVQLYGAALRPDQVQTIYRCPERCGCW